MIGSAAGPDLYLRPNFIFDQHYIIIYSHFE